MEHIDIHIKGIAPLLMHNIRLADPLDPWTKKLSALTGTRPKTDDIHAQIARVEFEGGLYFDEEIGPYMPANNLDKMLLEGGTLHKIGKIIKESTLSVNDRYALEYNGPRTVEGLYKAGFFDRRAIGIGRSKTIRTRPMYREWELKFTLAFDEERLNVEQLIQAVEDAGRYKGLGDYRPRFGRFEMVNGG